MTYLANFRSNPELYIKEIDFIVDSRKNFKPTSLPNLERCEYGGPCKLTEQNTAADNVIKLEVSNGGNDYYFPWVNRGVGEVKVPKMASEGTIVTTGGMNGCSLVVTELDNHYIFYHDADSKYLGKLKPAEGKEVCRIGPKDYSPLDIGNKLVLESPKEGLAYLHQIIIIKHGGKWKVFSSAILIGPGIDMPVKKAFNATVTKLMGTF